MDFAIATRRVDDSLLVSVIGELDMATAPEFEQAVELAQDGSTIVVDLRELTFIDSTGIRALLKVYASGQDGRSTVSFVRGSDSVQRVLQLAGAEQFLGWTDPLAEPASESI